MLKGISPVISPELLKILAEMGHGDELVLADAHFPAHSMNEKVIRADGIKVTDLLDGILPLFELDSYADALIMMSPASCDTLDPAVEESYSKIIKKHSPEINTIKKIGRFEFYEASRKAYAVVLTGELAKYANIIIKKGVTPIE